MHTTIPLTETNARRRYYSNYDVNKVPEHASNNHLNKWNKKLMGKITPRKTAGHDGVSARFPNKVATVISPVFTLLFNATLKHYPSGYTIYKNDSGLPKIIDQHR